ncbi:hypothetical protein PINS_up007392 [Pythium insidiosum]|nr:hypothetical protein PINS_up007392 [Pythium insidiosum]
MTTLSAHVPTDFAALPQHVVRVDDEPLHQERWKNDLVRIVDVQFPPHTTSLWHQHVHYGVYICVTRVYATEQGIHDEAPRQLHKQRGDIFCRDHTLDRLVHVVSTGELPMRIIEVEILKDDPNEDLDIQSLPVHQNRSISLTHQDKKCRVYRVALMPSTEELSICLPSRAVLVALDTVTVSIENASADDRIHVDHTKRFHGAARSLKAGDDVVLHAGNMTLRVEDWQHCEVASFVLCEVF